MREISGFKLEADSIPKKFYYLDSDITSDNRYVPLSREGKKFFFKAALLADATVLPTTNTSLYSLPQEYPGLFYSRAKEECLAPHVSFLFQGNYENYTDEIQSRIARLEKESPDSLEVGAYKKFNLDAIKFHDAILKKNNLIPIKKSKPSSIIFKDCIKSEVLDESICDAILEDRVLTEQGVFHLKNLLDEYSNKSIDRHTIITRLLLNGEKPSKCFENILHECFYNSNEESINNIVTRRRAEFSEPFIEPFLDMILFNEVTGISDDDLVQNSRLFYNIKTDPSFLFLKNVYFEMVRTMSERMLQGYDEVDFSNIMNNIDLINTNSIVKNLINAAHIYLCDVLFLKTKYLAKEHPSDERIEIYKKRSIGSGLFAIMVFIGLQIPLAVPTIVEFFKSKVSDFVKGGGNVKEYLFDKINEEIFFKKIPSADFNKHISELNQRIKYWHHKCKPVGWLDDSELKKIGIK